jgi:hypothetical protein
MGLLQRRGRLFIAPKGKPEAVVYGRAHLGLNFNPTNQPGRLLKARAHLLDLIEAHDFPNQKQVLVLIPHLHDLPNDSLNVYMQNRF